MDGVTGLAGPSMACNIAANIRQLCERHGSIAEACRGIGINRQQFNKYLSGRRLPGAATMRKLCEFFAISEKDLFLEPEAFKRATGRGNPAAAPCLPGKLGPLLCEMAEGAVDCISQGLYYAYYPWLRDATKTLRSLLVIRQRGGVLVFKRFTRIVFPGDNSKYCPRSKHDGLVFERQGTIFLAALEGRAPGGVSLMTFGRPAAGQTGVFVGLALVMTAWGDPIASRVTLEHLPSHASLRQALGRCGVIDLHSNDIDSVTRETIAAPSSEPVAQLLPFSAFQRALG